MGQEKRYHWPMEIAHGADITDDLFSAEVLERSATQPVLVDFWAPWCGPCRMLGPVLEKLAEEMAGAFYLAKLNTEECPRIASEFKISGIPAVKLFMGGKMVGEFSGALPESSVREFLAGHLPNEAKELYMSGAKLLAEKQLSEAQATFEKVIELEPKMHKARIELAKIALELGNSDSIAAIVEPISSLDEHREVADALLSMVGFSLACQKMGGLDKVSASIGGETISAKAYLEHGYCLASHGKYEEALDAFLNSVQQDAKLEEAAARKSMLVIFQVVGIRSDLANRYRRRLSIYI